GSVFSFQSRPSKRSAASAVSLLSIERRSFRPREVVWTTDTTAPSRYGVAELGSCAPWYVLRYSSPAFGPLSGFLTKSRQKPKGVLVCCDMPSQTTRKRRVALRRTGRMSIVLPSQGKV